MLKFSTFRAALLLSAAFALIPTGRLIAQQLAEPTSPAITTPQLQLASLDLPSLDLTPAPATANPEAAEFALVQHSGVRVPSREDTHQRFWDRENRILFAVAGGFAAADFCVTHVNLANGGRELNPITRVLTGSTPGLAANFVLETGGLIGIDYAFHKTGHHKLERAMSFVNIGGSAGAVAYGLSHR